MITLITILTLSVFSLLPFEHSPQKVEDSKAVVASDSDSMRVADWHEDLMFIKNKFETEHYNLFRLMEKKDWEDSFTKLTQNLPKLKDHEVITETMKIIAKVGDGHSALYPPYEGKYHFHQLPVSFHDFKDGLFIKGADPKYKSLVGHKLVSIGGISIEEVKKRLATITNRDNDQWIKLLGVEVYLTMPEILYALELSDNIESVTLELLNDKNEIYKAEIRANLFDISSTRYITVRPEWEAANKDAKAPEPLYLKHTSEFPKDFYWFEYLEEKSMVYFQLNVVFDKPGEDLKSFCERMLNFIKEKNVERLVIDIRLNSGGNNQLNTGVLDQVIKSNQINKEGNLFVIVGRRTFSAAMNLATNLEQKTNAIFVGEPTGSSPNFVGEDNPSPLPKSKLVVSVSNRYWQDSSPDDNRKWITQDIYNVLSSEDYKNNIDPNMDAILKYIDNK